MMCMHDTATCARLSCHDARRACSQIPGLVVSGDVTQDLERGYWPSYNVPYFPEVSWGSPGRVQCTLIMS